MRFSGVDELDITAYTDAHASATLADIAHEKWVALILMVLKYGLNVED